MLAIYGRFKIRKKCLNRLQTQTQTQTLSTAFRWFGSLGAPDKFRKTWQHAHLRDWIRLD